MRELRFDGLSPDGMRLVLAGNDGQKYTVAIDERLEAAVRRDRARMSQVELEQSDALRPREIQARIRAGATAEDVAAASGLTLEHVRRFEGPVLTERAWVAQQAQATEVRRPGGDIELGQLVAERLGIDRRRCRRRRLGRLAPRRRALGGDRHLPGAAEHPHRDWPTTAGSHHDHGRRQRTRVVRDRAERAAGAGPATPRR